MGISAEDIKSFVKNRISEKRYVHSINTANEAVLLAKRYGADEDKAYIAGLLHDVAKGLGAGELISIVQGSGMDVDEYETENPELMHGKAGAAIARSELGICDEDILSAIQWHTTGHKNMSLLEKIIYIADIIEPGRDFEETDTLRELAYKDLDSAMQTALEHVMSFVKRRGFSLHPNSIEAYKDIKKTEVKTNLKFDESVMSAAKQLFMKKAEDVRVLNVADLTIIADYFILASGRSDVHVRSLCDEVQKFMFEAGKQQLRLEGYREGRWIVIDYGDVLIHIFHRNEREFYGLERLWISGDNSVQITEDMLDLKQV